MYDNVSVDLPSHYVVGGWGTNADFNATEDSSVSDYCV